MDQNTFDKLHKIRLEQPYMDEQEMKDQINDHTKPPKPEELQQCIRCDGKFKIFRDVIFDEDGDPFCRTCYELIHREYNGN